MPFNNSFDPGIMLGRLRDKYQGDPDYEEDWNIVCAALQASKGNYGQTTCGNFIDEKESARCFDSIINPNFFINEKEVKGRRLFDEKPQESLLMDEQQKVRIDRILHPTEETIKQGWTWGPIAVEIKKSNMALGPVYAQVLDYRQSVFRSSYLGYTRILPLIFAIFPVKAIYYDLQSISSTQIILQCNYNKYDKSLKFGTSNSTAFELSNNNLIVNSNFSPSTKKGSRSGIKK